MKSSDLNYIKYSSAIKYFLPLFCLLLSICGAGSCGESYGASASPQQSTSYEPKIILTASHLARLKLKMDSNAPEYQALISWCDARINDIGYDKGDVNWKGYRMSGYSTYLMNYSLAYQLVKKNNPDRAGQYAAFVRRLLVDGIAVSLRSGEENNGLAALRCGETADRAINIAEGAVLGISTAAYKLGYSSRFLAAVPIAYDWIYETLTESDKSVLVPMMLRWYDWIQGVRTKYNNGVLKSGVRYYEDRDGDCTLPNNNCTRYTATGSLKGFGFGNMANNFMGGHTYLMALIPIAVKNDTPDASTYLANFKNLLTSTIIDQLESDTKQSGGDSVEGWNYGSGFMYALPGLYGYYTATADPLIATMKWPAALVNAMAHRLEGNLLNVPIYGDWTGIPLGENREYIAMPFVGILQQLHPDSAMAKVGQTIINSSAFQKNSQVQLWERVLWHEASFPEYPLTVLPLSNIARGNGLVTSRSSWSNTADSVHFAVRLEGKHSASHEGYDEGHMSLSRGVDRLLVHANMKGASVFHSTIVFNNTSHQASNPPLLSPAIYRQQEGNDYFYVAGDISNAWKRQWKPDGALVFKRSIIHLRPNRVIVFDTTRSNSALGSLKDWYTQYGSDPAIDVASGLISSSVGSSKVFVKTLYPFGGTFTKDAPVTSYWRVKFTPQTLQEYDQFLHVLESTASYVATMTPLEYIHTLDGNMRGVYIKDSMTPAVVLFSADREGADVAGNVSYTLPVSTETQPKHIIVHLPTDTAYTVSKTRNIDGSQTMQLILGSNPSAGNVYTTSSQGVLTIPPN